MHLKNSRIGIVIVEDEREVRLGLKYLLNLDRDLMVVKGYQRAEELLEDLERDIVPDIILMDINLPGMDGITATKRIKDRYPGIEILMLTIFEEKGKIVKALQAGAMGYILKGTDPKELAAQIKTLYSGGTPISPKAARKLIDEIQHPGGDASPRDYKLTPKETDILKNIVEGYTYKEIADIQGISGSTVKTHIMHIYRKLEVNSKVEFVKKVLKEELIRF